MTDAHYQFLKGSHNVTDEHESIEPPWRAFVTAGTRTAKVATVRTDGRPHIAPVAFVLDGDDLVFVTALDSVKGRTLRRTGIASATVDEETPPYPFVIIEGTVTTTEQPAELRRFASAIALRYVGAENVEDFTERNAVPGQILVRLTPHRVIARLNGQPRQSVTYTGSQQSLAITRGNRRS
jgi:PPOX class probable F420-dependent enzyme